MVSDVSRKIMEYFYAQSNDINQHEITLRGDESKHLARVLRKKEGEAVFITDGNGRMFEAVIEKIGSSTAVCRIEAVHEEYNETKPSITLAVSPLKNPGRFDFLIEKVTELGVCRIIPLLSERTISRRDKQERLQKIALAAMKQCGRSRLPEITPVVKFDELLKTKNNFELACIPHEQVETGKTLHSILKNYTSLKTVLIMIGPEGGFSEAEIQKAEEAGCIPLSLGVRRLRTETAAIAAVCALQSI
jgi:16S rRNA (uracil1498-N3)-methyltransferase